jgi:hypothetical protein
MHVAGKALTDLATWVCKPRAMVEGKVDRLRMEYITLQAIVRDIARRQSTRDVLFIDHVPVN